MALKLPGVTQILSSNKLGQERVSSNPEDENFIQDNFRGSAINDYFWIAETLGTGTVTERDGQLKLYSGTTDLNYAMLKCKWGGSDLGGSTGYSIEVNFRKNISVDADADILIGFVRDNDDPANLQSWEAFRNFDGNIVDLTPETDDSGVTDTGTTISTFQNNAWYRIKIVVDKTGDTAKFYNNGVLVDTLTELETNYMGFVAYVRCRNASTRAATLDLNWVKLAINAPEININP